MRIRIFIEFSCITISEAAESNKRVWSFLDPTRCRKSISKVCFTFLLCGPFCPRVFAKMSFSVLLDQNVCFIISFIESNFMLVWHIFLVVNV